MRVSHGKDLVARTYVQLRVAMTIQAPLHGQRRSLPRKRHTVHTPVALCAADSLVYVDTVVEVHILGKVIDSRPLNGFAAPIAFPDRLERRAGRPHLRVAVHTGFGGGDIRESRVFNRRMAVAAINAQAANMMFVAEGYRLLTRNVLHCLVM